MEMETNKLKSFIDKCAMSNGADMGRIIFDKDEIKLDATSIDKTSFFVGTIKSDTASDYKSIGEFCIRDLSMFSRYLSNLGEFVDITIDDKNTIVFKSGNKEITSKIADKDLLDEINEPSLEFSYMGNIKSSVLKDIIKDTSIFGASKQDSSISMNIHGDVLTLTTSNNDDTVKHTIKLGTESKEDINVKFSTNLLSKIVSNITTNFVTINMGSDYPLKIEEVYEKDTNSCWIIAPYVE